MAICARCERIWTTDSGTNSSRRKIVKMMMASAPATPAGIKPISGVATNSSPCMIGWTRKPFQIGSRALRFNDQGSSSRAWRAGLIAQQYRANALRDRVVSTSAPGLTARQTCDGQPRAAHQPMPLDGGVRVMRAGGLIAAGRREARSDGRLVDPDQAQQRTSWHVSDGYDAAS